MRMTTSAFSIFAVVTSFAVFLSGDASGGEEPSVPTWVTNIADDDPGCAVSTRKGDEAKHIYRGLANLEHATQIDESTVFEAGSIAKQFTAATVMILALEGKIELDDPIGKYFPELPKYANDITIRMLVHHNSGLRDWGTVAAIAGLGRSERIFNNHDVINILARQVSLNHDPEQFFSYTNSGYSLLAILIERVSGISFDEYSAKHIFEPLGMAHTQWRSNFNRIVPGRATAYRKKNGDAWESHMPFENVVGNGGLLTTTSDLLRFSYELHHGKYFTPDFRTLMYRLGNLTSLQPMAYASGLFIGEFVGYKEIYHGGATTGYRAFLVDYPQEQLTIALLCNRADVRAAAIAREIARSLLVDEEEQPPSVAALRDADAMPNASPEASALAGGYQIVSTGQLIEVSASGEALVIFNQVFSRNGTGQYASENGMVLSVEQGANTAQLTNTAGHTFQLRYFEAWDNHDLAEYEGGYVNAEAPASYVIKQIEGQLFLENSGNPAQLLVPTHKDQFLIGPTNTRFTFLRGEDGRISAARLSTGRVWNMQFSKLQN